MDDAGLPQDQGAPKLAATRGMPPIETRFQPGVSGNPGGRPRGACPRKAFLRKIAEHPNEHGEGKIAASMGERMAELVIALQSAPDAVVERIYKELHELRQTFSEAEGKPTEHVVQESANERVIVLRNPPPVDTPLPDVALPVADEELSQ